MSTITSEAAIQMPQDDPALAPVGAGQSDPSLAQDLRQLALEAKALAQTEIAFQKSRAAFATSETKTIALLLVAALIVVLFALMALVVGTVIALGPLLGPWGAMGLVTLALIAIAAACALSARSRIRHVTAVIRGDAKS